MTNSSFGPVFPEAGIQTNSASASGFHVAPGTVYSAPAGNGSAKSLNANNWTTNDYFQIRFGMSGYHGLRLVFDQTGSSTGPAEFRILYSTDGSSFVSFTNYSVPKANNTAVSWSSTSSNAASTVALNLSALAGLSNVAQVYLRILPRSTVSITNGTVGTTGASRFDNVTVRAMPNIPNTFGNLTYSDEGQSITITGATQSISGALTIPSTINGKPVVAIGPGAFADFTGLVSVIIPSSVTTIGNSAFSGCRALTSVSISFGVTSIGADAFRWCSELTSVSIPASVASIGSSAFSGCSALTSVTISEGVTTIGAYAFFICSRLASVTIPSTVTSIGTAAFGGTDALTSFSVDAANSNYSSADGVLFNKLKTVLIRYPAGRSGAYTVPHGVTTIENDAFADASRLTSVVIPPGVTSLGSNAFTYCSSLKSVSLPFGITSIGFWAFYGCTSLESLVIPASVTSIGPAAFYNCRALKSLTIPASVTSISSGAFADCTGLTSIDVDVSNLNYSSLDGVLFDKQQTMLLRYPPGRVGSYVVPIGVTAIGDDAFAGSAGLTSVTIPLTVTSIGWSAFYDCVALTAITIPPSVTRIEGWTFYGCSALTSVTLPASITSIGNSAFAWSRNLASAIFLGNAPTMGSNVFGSTAAGFTIRTTSTATGFTYPTWSGYQSVNNVQPPPPRIMTLSGNLAFGSVAVNFTGSAILNIGNAGTAPLTVSSIVYPAGFSGDWSGGSIAPGATQNVTVTFSPTVVQAYHGTVAVISDMTSGTSTVSLSAISVPVGGGSTDMFVYDSAGRLIQAIQSNGLIHDYAYDEEGNILSVSLSSTDTSPDGGSGNGIADWWERFYFDTIGIDPLVRGADGIPMLMKFALGLDPGTDSVAELPFSTVEEGNLTLTFRKARAATNLNFMVQKSSDLRTWTDLTAETSAALSLPPVTGLSDAESDSYEVSVPMSGSRMFMRLKVRTP